LKTINDYTLKKRDDSQESSLFFKADLAALSIFRTTLL